jgi:serine/threonine protein kinase
VQTQVRTAEAHSSPLCDPGDGLVPGQLAGPWQIERELGRGGMGTVYAVTHTEIGKTAALKVVHRKVTSPSDRMMVEAKVVNRVGHPNIVDIFEVGHLPDGRPYLVMEKLEGQPLSHRADDGKLLPDQVIAILLQVCDALIAAHAAGIVHRDLKLDNVFLVDNPDDLTTPRVKLLDWGIAKVIDSVAGQSPACTVDGQLVGTPQYLAPEQARGGQVSPKTDVYSLGVMAYELFLEQLPFEAETAAEIMTMHLRAIPPPCSDMWPDIPPRLEELIHEMLAKSPAHRPTMLEVAHRLEAIRGDLNLRRSAPIAAPPVASVELAESPVRPEWQPARRWQWAVGAAALAAIGCLFLISHTSDTAAATSEVADELFAAPESLRPAQGDVRLSIPPPPEPLPPPAPPVVDPELLVPALVDAVGLPVESPDVGAAPIVVKQPAPRARPVVRAQANRAAKLAPVVPRRNAKLDPDGTFDPYR